MPKSLSKDVKPKDWKLGIDSSRVGAEYFLSQPARPVFIPADYISFRALGHEDSYQLLSEWSQWMDDLGQSSYEHIRRRAKSAETMTKYDIDKYYETIKAKSWRDEIDANRGYFVLQHGRLDFNSTDYIAFRRLERSESHKLPIEWPQWIMDLMESGDEHVRRKANAALMTRDDIHGYYKNFIVDEHELEILGLSSKQTIGGSHHLASLLEDRQ
ncbi:hypothetical protein BGX27_003273, partial [Mortierella sp. AM989]